MTGWQAGYTLSRLFFGRGNEHLKLIDKINGNGSIKTVSIGPKVASRSSCFDR